MESLRAKILLPFICVSAAMVLGVGVLIFSPILGKNVLFLAAIPVASLVLLVMFLDAKWMMLILLYTRSMLDPVLNLTKIGGGDAAGAGMGAVLNLLVLVLIGVLILRFPKKFSGNNPMIRQWGIFCGVCGLSVLYSPERMQSIKLLMNLLTYVAIVTIPIVLVRTSEDKKNWIRHLYYSSFMPVGFAIVGFATKQSFFYSFGRLKGTFTHANILAFYLVFIITVIFYILKSGEFKLSGGKRFFHYVYLIVVAGVLIVTGTRSAWLACAGFFFIYSFLKERRNFFILLVIVPLLIFVPQVKTRVDDLMTGTGQTRNEKLNAMTWRLKLWSSSMDSIKRRPILGYGLGSFEYYSSSFFSLEKKSRTPAHNAFIEILFETGLLGLVSYFMIYGTALKICWRKLCGNLSGLSREAAIVFSSVIGYLLVCFSDNTLYYLAFNWYFWFFIGLMMHYFLSIAEGPQQQASEPVNQEQRRL